jgi:DNA-binding beta-propeller fold protein YncE
MKEKKMMALSVGKKRELGALSSMLAKTVGIVSLVAILASCGTSPGYNYTVGGTVDGLVGSGLVLQNNGGDDHPISADGYFTFATPLTDGAAYNITVKTQPASPAQSCRVVSNGTGTINSNPVSNVVVSCMTSPTSIAFSVESGNEFAYVANMSDNTISAYSIGSGGALTAIGNPNTIGTGTIPVFITVDPSKQFVYVANEFSNSISIYTIDPTFGTLAASATPTVTVGNNPTSVVTVSLGSSGEFAYVTNLSDSTISAYSIDLSNGGALTAISGSPFNAGTLAGTLAYPSTITIDPSGQFAYVINSGDGSIWAYPINQSTGVLGTPLQVK